MDSCPLLRYEGRGMTATEHTDALLAALRSRRACGPTPGAGRTRTVRTRIAYIAANSIFW